MNKIIYIANNINGDFMNIDIRSHIINNFKEDNKDSIRSAIQASIKEKDEITLPGLGVFFEIIWQNCNEELKETLLNIIEKNVK